MRLRKSLIGQPCRVEFDDHTENVGHVVRVVAYGALAGYDRTTIRILSWHAPGEPTYQNAVTEFAILRRTIIKDGLQFLRPVERQDAAGKETA